MGQCICIFDLKTNPAALPQSIGDFGDLLTVQARIPYRPNPRFLLLARELERRFPWKEPKDRSRDDLIVWLNSPVVMSGVLDSAIWNFDLPEQKTAEVFVHLVKLAKIIGLVLYNDDLGVGFLPDGTVVPPEMEHLWQETRTSPKQDRQLDTYRDAYQALCRAFDVEIGPAGFVQVRDERKENDLPENPDKYVRYERRLGPVVQRITCEILMSHNACRDLTLTVADDRISHILDTFYGCSKKRTAIRVNADFFFPTRRYMDFDLNTERDAGPVALYARDKLLPIADLATDLRGIDQVLNHPSTREIHGPRRIDQGFRNRPAGHDGSIDLTRQWLIGPGVLANDECIVAARLNGNPYYARVETAYLTPSRGPDQVSDPVHNERLQAGHAKWLETRKNLAEYVRSQVAPLTSWSGEAAYEAAVVPFPPTFHDCPPHRLEQRPHNWEFTHRLIDAIKRNPEEVMARFGGSDGADRLVAEWGAHGLTLPEVSRIPPEGMQCRLERWTHADLPEPADLLVLTFPPIVGMSEIQAIALVRCGSLWHCSAIGHENEMAPTGIRTQVEMIGFRMHEGKPRFFPYTSAYFQRPPESGEWKEVVAGDIKRVVRWMRDNGGLR